MAYTFYDVESLDNVFTIVTYDPSQSDDEDNVTQRAKLEIYYLVDDENELILDEFGGGHHMPPQMMNPTIEGDPNSARPNPDHWNFDSNATRLAISGHAPNHKRIASEFASAVCERTRERNPAIADINPDIELFDLKTPLGACRFMVKFLIKLERRLPSSGSWRPRLETLDVVFPSKRRVNMATGIVKDTDKAFAEHPERYPYLLGYNSYNYDTTMLAKLAYELFVHNVMTEYRETDTQRIMDYDRPWVDRKDKLQPAVISNPSKDDHTLVGGINPRVNAYDLRMFNNLLFTDTHRSDMAKALRTAVTPALYLGDIIHPTSTRRGTNSEFGIETYESRIRQNMLMTGRHLDVARLNEKQARVGLKRLLGMMGHQILESEKLSDGRSRLQGADDLLELIAYNVSDVIYLAALFDDPVYKSQFEQKSNMLVTYPELVYEYKTGDDSGKREIDRRRVRRNRLFADSSSQQLASRSLCPDGALVDAMHVDLNYPHEANVTGEEGDPGRRDILDECHDFFYDEVLTRITDKEEHDRAKADFDHVERVYRKLTQYNFDEGAALQRHKEQVCESYVPKLSQLLDKASESGSLDRSAVIAVVNDCHKELCAPYVDERNLERLVSGMEAFATRIAEGGESDYHDNLLTMLEATFSHGTATAADIRSVSFGLPKNIFYYDGDGKRTSCFATFSTGGVHGAECGLTAYQADFDAYLTLVNNIAFLQARFGEDQAGAIAFRKSLKSATKPVVVYDTDGETPIPFPDGREDHLAKEFLSDVTLTSAKWRKPTEPRVFKQEKEGGPDKLDGKYAWTSAAYVNHEDFSSYYPSLLRMMRVFWNDQLGYDRYGEIYHLKEVLGKQMKETSDPTLRYKLGLDRSGVKLILNTASGAGDAKFDNPVRMNNNIIAMRVIGQLFTWRIGQAQALHGAKVISTNTDGLYTKMEKEENDRLLEIEQKKIGVLIEPEPMYLISKDSNNRIEFDITVADEDTAPVVAVAEDGTYVRATVDPRRGLTDRDGNPVAEGTPVRFRVLSVAGGTLACREGPSPSRSLAHSAATDWMLSEYLMRTFAAGGYRQHALEQPFDARLAEVILDELLDMRHGDKSRRIHGLMLLQNVIASNPSSHIYVFATKISPEASEMLARLAGHDETNADNSDAGPAYHDLPRTNGIVDRSMVRLQMQHYNRVFAMREGTPNTVHILDAAARIVPAPTKTSRARQGKPICSQQSEAAVQVMRLQGEKIGDLMGNASTTTGDRRDIIAKTHPGLDPEWNMLIENRDLWRLDDATVDAIYDNIDRDVYVKLLADAYENNWRNHV